MHIQAKSKTALSPSNLAAFLAVLGDPANGDPINIEGVAGGSLEVGGDFAFSLPHDKHDEGVERLRAAGYKVEETNDLYAEEVDGNPNSPGKLWAIIQRAKDSPEAHGRAIQDVLVGMTTNAPHRVYVQVTFSEEPFWDPGT